MAPTEREARVARSAGWRLACLSFLPGLACPALLLAAAPAAPAADADPLVFYLVTYADGSVRRLPAVPRTAEGIINVLRFARADPGGAGREALSADPNSPRPAQGAPIYIGELKWNGKAWMAPARGTAAGGDPGSDRGQRARPPDLNASLLDLAARLVESREALAGVKRDAERAEREAAAAEARKMRQELAASAAALAQAGKKLSESAAEREAAVAEARKMRQELAASAAALLEAGKKLSESAAEREAAAAEAQKTRQELVQSAAALAEAGKKLAAVTAEREAAAAEARKTRQELMQCTAALAEAGKKLAAVTTEREAAAAEARKTRQELMQCTAALAEAGKKLAAVTAEREAAAAEARKTRQELVQSTAALAEARKELTALTSAIQSATRPAGAGEAPSNPGAAAYDPPAPGGWGAFTVAQVVAAMAATAAGVLLVVVVVGMLGSRRRVAGAEAGQAASGRSQGPAAGRGAGSPRGPLEDPAEVMDRLWALRISPQDVSGGQDEADERIERMLADLRARLDRLAERAKEPGADPDAFQQEVHRLLARAVDATRAIDRQLADVEARRRLRRDLLAYLLALDVPRTVQDVLLAMAATSPFRLTAADLIVVAKELSERGLIECSGPLHDWRTTVAIHPGGRSEARRIAFGGAAGT